MNSPRRRALPDNLDPLVDTLSNVVGILVIVIALTQLELGDAVARVAGELAGRSPAAEHAATPPSPVAVDPELDLRRERARARGGEDLGSTARALERALADLKSMPVIRAEQGAAPPAPADGSRESLEIAVAQARDALDAARESLAHRRAYAAGLAEVPRHLVARLPDPQIIQGREAWLFVRHGRVYLVDREALFEQGRRAIERIVRDGTAREIRADEFESVAHYLRKSDIGHGHLRWSLETDPAVHLQLAWRSRDGGIERSRLATDPELRAWLARHRPGLDSIRFHVWSDSFETYLEARTQVEAAGFRAGWTGHEADEEFGIRLRFGAPLPEIRPLEVD